MNSTEKSSQSRLYALVMLTRSIFHLGVVAAVTNWGFMGNPLPHPGLLYGFVALIISVIVWALFLSPRPVIGAEKFLQALIDLLFIGAGTIGLLLTNFPVFLPIIFGLLGMLVSYLSFTWKPKQ